MKDRDTIRMLTTILWLESLAADGKYRYSSDCAAALELADAMRISVGK